MMLVIFISHTPMYIKHEWKVYKEVDLNSLDKDELKAIIKDLEPKKSQVISEKPNLFIGWNGITAPNRGGGISLAN